MRRYPTANPCRLVITAATSILLLGGCSVGPDYRPQAIDAARDWNSLHGGNADLRTSPDANAPQMRASRWNPFDDAMLERLQQRAQASSPDLQTAALHLAQSRLQRLIVSAQRGVQVHGSAGISRQNQSENGSGSRLINAIAPPASRDELIKTVSQPFDLYQIGFDASWELDLWGRIRRSLEAADADTLAAAALLDDTRLSLTSELARDYYELRGSQEQLRITRDNIRATEEILELIQARADAGLIDDLDVERQRTQLENLRAQLPSLMAQEAATRNRITLLVGAKPGELGAELDPHSGGDGISRWPDFSVGLPSDIARNRPDVRAAEANLHAATAAIGVATADLYPRFALGAAFGYEATESGDIADWRSRQWSVGPSLNLPIFDHGRRRATIALRKVEQQQAAVAFQRAVLTAWHDVDNALSAYNAERRRNQHLREQQRSSEVAYSLARTRYESGLTDFIVELDAQRTYLQARSDLAQSDSQLRVLMVALYKAVGGEPTTDEMVSSRTTAD